MSHPKLVYPPAAYEAEPGEASATLRRHDAPAEVEYASGGTAHYLATRLTTNGQYGLYRWDMSPTPSGPDPHFHRTISEAFFVLSGAVRLYDTHWIR